MSEPDIVEKILAFLSIPMLLFTCYVIALFLRRHGADLVQFWKANKR